MAVNGVAGLGITGTLSNGESAMQRAVLESENNRFESLVHEMEASAKASRSSEEKPESKPLTGVSSSQISSNHRLNGDYTQGFYNYYTSRMDKEAAPEGMATGSTGKNGKPVVIDRTSDLYAQSKEMENYMVKIMLSSMRDTIHHTSLTGKEENSYAREMYEDMLYDNYAEQLTKNSHFGLADQIYLELSGLR